jgi:hypothetical protein
VWQGVKVAYEYFDFGLFLSPSFYFWIGEMGSFLAIPVCTLIGVLFVFEADGYRERPYRWVAAVLAGGFVVNELLLLLCVQSWPLLADPERQIHLRMLPFISCTGCYPIH